MREITKQFNVPEPFPTVELRLPYNSGTVKVKLKRFEQRGSDLWLLVAVPRWSRWSTQVQVGEKAYEGISPGVEDLWAPAFAVTADSEVFERLEGQYRRAA